MRSTKMFSNFGTSTSICTDAACRCAGGTRCPYGRMARVYPSAGSAYTYVGRALHPSLGYVTGWSMTMDYILNPVICTIWAAKAMADLLGGTRYQIPYPGLLWPIFFAVLFTVLNLRGVHTSARINQILC